MRSMIPSYPSGAAGAGLLLLRMSVASWLLATISLHIILLWQQLGIVAAASAIAVGFRTRLVASLCLLLAVERMIGSSAPLATCLPAVLSVAALALSGPGAASMDARLFGRRTIVLPNVSDDPKL